MRDYIDPPREPTADDDDHQYIDFESEEEEKAYLEGRWNERRKDND